jgi:hypothetical protein
MMVEIRHGELYRGIGRYKEVSGGTGGIEAINGIRAYPSKDFALTLILYLPTPPYTSLHLPIPPYISLYFIDADVYQLSDFCFGFPANSNKT